MPNQPSSLGNPRVNTIQHLGTSAISVAILLVLTFFTSQAMQAQAFSVIHNFSGGASDGGSPLFGVTADRGGNLYGITSYGGDLSCNYNPAGCGVVYKITPGHTLSTLYTFTGGSDGYIGNWLTFGPNGTLYGTTLEGGEETCYGGYGCGTVFNLQPPAHTCGSISCPWRETVLYRFQGQPDASAPFSLVFDSHGNIFGVSETGGAFNWGAVFELTPSGSGWTEQVIYSFTNRQDGAYPNGVLAIDSLGNLYGTADYGQNRAGTIFELSPSGSGWTETTLFAFGANPATGTDPVGGLVVDSSGNLYGSNEYGTPSPAVFELSPSSGGWSYQVLHYLSSSGQGAGQYAPLARDSAGDLYGTSEGVYNGSPRGTVYKLSSSGGSWLYDELHDFSGGDGEYPTSGVSFDANGNLYGTTSAGGANGFGVVWEITP
jgi:uncharacterized repeat protein (TIGR03803 family)